MGHAVVIEKIKGNDSTCVPDLPVRRPSRPCRHLHRRCNDHVHR